MTYKNLKNKMMSATIIAIVLAYIGFFFFATVKYQFQPLGTTAEHRRYAFSTNKRVHLFLKKVYTPMRALFKNHYHFLTEEEFAVTPDFRTTGLSGICIPKTVKRMHENEQKTKDVYG